MVDRSAGQSSWPLSPYDLNVTYGKPNAAGLGPDWFGPLEPIAPLAPPEVAGRQWDYLSGYNLATFPRGYAPISFATLRGLADGYDLLRLVIETRKDQVARLSWNISARDKKASANPRLAALRKFFSKPDGRHGFADWLRMILEDLFVIDAPTLYMSRDRAGHLLGLLPIDGATIKPVIDDWGRTPLPYIENGETIYPVAFQQILKGYPAVDYSVRDLLYRPRNIRVDRAYSAGTPGPWATPDAPKPPATPLAGKVMLFLAAGALGAALMMGACDRADAKPIVIAPQKHAPAKLTTPDQIIANVLTWAAADGDADLAAAIQMAKASNDNVTLPCWTALQAFVGQVKALPPADQLPNLHLATDVEIATDLMIALEPNSPVVTQCQALANFQKMTAINMVTGILTGALSIGKLAPIIP